MSPLTVLPCALLLAVAVACSGSGASRTDGDARPPALIPADAAGVLNAVRGAGARAVMVNVWATFCLPCREEFPDMMRLYDTYRDRGFRLVLVSADFPGQADQARAFLASQGVPFDSYIKQEKDADFINALNPEWSGAIPATWVYDAEGRLLDFWEGKATYATFEGALLKALAGRSDRTNP